MDEPVQPGEILAKKYRVEKVLGVGGMGVVVSATHLELDQKVARKLMHANVYATEEAKSGFPREARIASKLRSESPVDSRALERETSPRFGTP